ncbi:MAG: ABC transporter permease [Lentisphaeria bacterium]|nr:ABC transporter permease [Lentisphaeria bacterium]
MLIYIGKRLILAIFTLLAILALSYTLLRLAPGDPARSSLFSTDGGAGVVNSEQNSTLGENQSLREELYLDKPVLTGFLLWLEKVVMHGDFGKSAVVDPGRNVMDVIGDKVKVTLLLNILAILLTYLIAVPSGIYSALKVNSWQDKTITLFYFILYSLPGIWVALLLQTLFCEGGKFPVFPLKGLSVADADLKTTWRIMGETLFHCVLPVVCLSYAGLAGLSRFARNGMLEVMHKDYIRTARAKGCSEFEVVYHHGFRNALITLITLFAGLLPSLVAGSVIVEYVFNIPGMGNLSLLALSSRDYPLQMALFAIAGSLTLGGILIADILYGLADPRIKLE